MADIGDRPVDRRTPLAVLTPLALEGWAVRSALPDVRVEHTGAGVRRSREVLERLDRDGGLDGCGAILIAGFAGAVAPGLSVGDVVVASELRAPNGSVQPCPAGAPLVAALRRRGLTVHHGPLRTVAQVAHGAWRPLLAADGVLAVDLESAVLATAARGRPVAVVRVVTDTPTEELLRPGIVRAGLTSLRSLRAAAPAFVEWAAAVRPRHVLLAGPRSFCAGVERAIDVVERALERYPAPIYVRKQIVHNAHVVADLERRGAVFVDELDEVPPGATCVFSAHGVAPAVREDAARRRLTVVDATCPLVTKVHSEARRFAGRGDTVVFIGHAGHEETEGTLGEAPERMQLVESAADVATLEVDAEASVSYLMQTTLATDEAGEIVDALRARFPAASGPGSDDICYATTNRQLAVRAVAQDADVVLVVGSTNSSNSRRLVEVAQRAGRPAYLVDDAGQIDPTWLAAASTVGLTAGASAPPGLVDEVVTMLAALGPVTVAERSVATESLQFTLPKEVS